MRNKKILGIAKEDKELELKIKGELNKEDPKEAEKLIAANTKEERVDGKRIKRKS